MRARRPDPDLLQQWVFHDGVPPARIGARLGLSRAAGYAWLQRYGIVAGGPCPTQQELLREWRSGLPVPELAARNGLTPQAVSERLIAAAALTPARRYHVLGAPGDPLPRERLQDWHVRQGLTVAEIAARTGATARQVRYRIKQYGLTQGRPAPEVDPDEALRRARDVVGRARHTLAQSREIVTAARAHRAAR